MKSQSLTGSRKMKTLLLVTVIVSIADGVVGGLHPGPSMPGSPSNISSSDRSLRRVALAAAHSFNDQSNDAFLFKPSAILGAQRQVNSPGHDCTSDGDLSRESSFSAVMRAESRLKCFIQVVGGEMSFQLGSDDTF
uniref:Uncharacterized protein n=1 Tax=Amphiprion percula TaxID=161767 RepID=A0A3P8THH1_AMPPE